MIIVEDICAVFWSLLYVNDGTRDMLWGS